LHPYLGRREEGKKPETLDYARSVLVKNGEAIAVRDFVGQDEDEESEYLITSFSKTE
jgi:hypothetical protein